MQRFKNNISDGWLFKQELRLFRNFMRNWQKDVDDCDFFDIFENSNNSTRDEAKQLLKKHFSLRELEPVNGIECAYRESNNARDRKQPRKREIVDIHIRRDIDYVIQEVWNTKPLRKRCRAMLEEWCDLMERRKTRTRKQADPMERRIAEVCRVLKLNDVEREVLLYAVVRCMTCFDDFPVGHTRGRNDRVTFYAMAIDRPCSAVTRALEAKGKLRSYKVLDNDGDFDRHGAFRNYLEGGDGEMLEGQFYRKVSVADALPWDYYGKLSERHGPVLKDMIRAAQGRHGLNILLYGAPGTGKTSFAKTLAKELGFDLFEIRQGDRDGEDVSPESRMAGIRICNNQVPTETSMVMVDEADQLLRTSFDFFSSLFGGRGDSGTEKGVINTLLDEGKLPTIWISNAPARTMDDSVRRRFDYSVCFEKLNARQRQMIWRNNVEKLHLSKLIAPEMIETLAGKYETSAGGITMVLENVKRMRPSKDKAPGLIETLIKPHCKLMGLDRTASDRLSPAKDYSLDGLNIKGDIALENIVTAVRNFREEADEDAAPDRPRMNLLLWGPPGTGKTEFVKHLGKATGGKVLVKMGSDILSKWVGGTEENLRAAFAEAEAENAILFLDEIDGLVQDRTMAGHSWEVTQVNELLYQMENFKGVMVGATNFMSNLDAAIMRRFTFKLQFDYLEDEGKRLFFERMFKTSLTAEDLDRLRRIPNLAPGDFRTVRQSTYYLGGATTNAMRLTELEKESSLKKGTAAKIGF